MSFISKLFNKNDHASNKMSLSEGGKNTKKHSMSVIPDNEEDLLKKKSYLELLIENMEKNLIDADKATQKECRDVLQQFEKELEEINLRLQKFSPTRPKHSSVVGPISLASPELKHGESEMIPKTQANTVTTNDSDGEDADADAQEGETTDTHKLMEYNGYQYCSIKSQKAPKVDAKQMENMMKVVTGSDSAVTMAQEGLKIEFNLDPRNRKRTQQMQRTQSLVDEYNQVNTSYQPDEGDEVFKPKGMFEDFFVVGIDRSDLQKGPSDIEKDESQVSFKTLYQFKEGSVNVSSYGSYLFPEGIQPSGKVKSEEGKLELITKLLNKSRDISKNPIIVLPFEPPPELLTCTWDPYTEKLNLHRRLYLISIICKDFIATKDPDDESIITYHQVKYGLGFLTYYPITPLFINFLQQVYDVVRNVRKLKIPELTDPYEFDLIGATKNYDSLLGNILRSFHKNYKSLKFGMEHLIYLDGPQQKFRLTVKMPLSEDASNLEAIWGAQYVFTQFSYSDIILILSAFMLEKKIVLFSEDMTKLTSLETALFALMKPFAYPYKPTFSLPKYLIPILGVNISTIIGLNQSEHFFWEEELIEQFPDCVYIFIDDMKVYALNKETQIKKLPLLPFSQDTRLSKTYHDLNPSLERIPVYTKSKIHEGKNKQFKHSKSNPVVMSETDISIKIKDIFFGFKNCIFETLVKPILKYDWICTSEDEKQKFILDYGKRSSFHKAFIQTQTLMLFVEAVEDRVKKSVSLFNISSN